MNLQLHHTSAPPSPPRKFMIYGIPADCLNFGNLFMYNISAISMYIRDSSIDVKSRREVTAKAH